MSLGIVATAFARPDRNAFLNHRALSVDQLVAQVKRDPAVMDRYQRHFHMSKSEVVSYLSSLRVSRLTKDGAYRVYSVPPNEVIKMHTEVMPKGMPVFVDVSGAPVMVLRCGNPLAKGPKKPILEPEIDAKDPGESAQNLRDVPENEILTPYSSDLISATMPMNPTVPDEAGPTTTGDSHIPVLAAAPNILNWLLALGGGAMVIVGGDHVVVVSDSTPEPMSLVVMTAGAGLLMAGRARRRARRN